MTTSELQTYFEEGFKNFSLDRKNMENYLEPSLVRMFPRTILNEIVLMGLKDMIENLVQKTKNMDAIIEMEMLGFKGKKEQAEFCESQLRILMKFRREDYIRYFSIDNFHTEIFQEEVLGVVATIFFNRLVKELEKWSKIKSIEIKNISRSEIDSFISTFFPKEQIIILNSFEILVKSQFYKTRIDNYKKEEAEQPRLIITEVFDPIEANLGELTPKPEKDENEPNKESIIFKNHDIVELLFQELKGYFPENKKELKQVLSGNNTNELLHFPHNQNKLVEVFKRLKYNGYILNTPKEITNWICSNFTYQYKRGSKKEIRGFNPGTVNDIFTKEKGEPPRKERICKNEEWLPYKSPDLRQRETENEKQ